MMDSMNGVLSPPSHSDSVNSPITFSAKRKRDESLEDHSQTNGVGDSKSAGTTGPTIEHSRALIQDFLDVLKTHDNSSSILTRPLPDRDASSEPLAKRLKAEGSNEPSSIMTRFSSNTYSSIDDVLDDIDSCVSEVIEKLQLPTGAARNQYMPIPTIQIETSMRVTAFKKRAHDLAQRARASIEKHTIAVTNGTTNTASYLGNGVLGSNAFTQINANAADNKLVLTLYGNAPQAKQLFSSLQMPTQLHGENKAMVQSLREAGLPNGITATQIIPIQATGLVDERKRVATLGELFPTPSTVPPLQPPKPSKIATTRSSVVGWYQPATADAPSRSTSYFKQSISTGQWLDYSNAAPTQVFKRKQRDRTMSLGSSKAPQQDVEPVESEPLRLEALFRSAYSGFAPTKDDAAAIAPEGLMNRIWWQRAGEKSFERLVEDASGGALAHSTAAVGESTAGADDIDETDKFQEAVEQWGEGSIDPTLVPLEAGVEKSAGERDIEEVLQDVSELLETLNSYQRIRHLSLNPSSRPVSLLSAPDASSAGTPSKPSEAELATYEILKSQLTLIISTLPPYAVAKLDSNKLADLSIGTKLEIRMDDFRGVMEEDEAAARAKVAAMSANSTVSRAAPSPAIHRSNSSALYGNQYAPSRSAAPSSHQYYGSAQTPVRPPSSGMQRPPSSAPGPYQSQRLPSGAPYRSTAYSGPSYPHQTPRPSQQQYPSSNTPQYIPTPTSQTYNRPGQSYQNVPQSAPQSTMAARYPSQHSYAHQNSAAQNGNDYRYGNGVNNTGQTSPQKPLYSPQPSVAQTQTRPSYSTTSEAQDHRSYLQAPITPNPILNGGSSQSPQPQQQQTGPTTYSSFMTTEQRANMMERQRAHMAQQSTQHQARNAAQASTLGSPSKTQINGGNAVAAAL